MTRALALFLALLASLPAAAAMYEDARNAVLPDARKNLGINFISPVDYGAVCDGDSHPLNTKYSTLAAAQADYPSALDLVNEIDGVAINKAFDRAREILAVPGLLPAVQVVLPAGNCRADVSINATMLEGSGVEVQGSGSYIRTTAAGKVAWDGIGSSLVRWTDISIYSPTAATAPAIGFQLGRYASNTTGASHYVKNLYVSGMYRKASCINLASESTTWAHVFCHNNMPVAGFTGSVSGTTLTVSAVSAGTIYAGMPIRSTSFPTGTGYTVGDLLTVTGGTCGTPPVIKVDAVLNNGAISAWSISNAGSCTVDPPTTPLTTSGGTGTGAQLQGSFTGGPPTTLTAVTLWDGIVKNGTYITALGTGTGGTGTYTISASQTVASQTMATNSYAYIADGINHFGLTSEYVTTAWATDLAQSFLVNNYVNAEFRTPTASVPVWMSATHQHRITSGYILSTGGDHLVDLYSIDDQSDNRSLYLDVHYENNTVPYVYYITGPNATPRLPGFRWIADITFPLQAIFKTAPNITGVQMYAAEIRMPHANVTTNPRVATVPSLWGIGGDFQLTRLANMNIANWVGGRGYIENTLSTRSESPLGDPVNLYSKWASLSYTGSINQTCLLSVPIPILHPHDTIEVSVLGERILGAARPDTDEVNINVAYQGGGCVPGTTSSGGTLLHKAVLNSAAAATTNIVASFHNTEATNAQVFAANSIPGGVGVSGGPIGTSAVITTSNPTPVHVMVRCQNVTNATDTCAVRGVTIKLIPGKS